MSKIHASVTQDRVMKAAEDQMFGIENPGFCIACGADHDACEPDARNYECIHCGERQVYGAQELLIMMVP